MASIASSPVVEVYVESYRVQPTFHEKNFALHGQWARKCVISSCLSPNISGFHRQRVCRQYIVDVFDTRIGNHSFRATGITAYLKNGGAPGKAASMVNHACTRTTQLYYRMRDEMSLDEVERILI
jgi:integrase